MRENIKLLWKTLKISNQVRSKLSVITITLGFVMAFVPAVIANQMKILTNAVQYLMEGKADMHHALQDAFILIGMFVVQLVYSFFKEYTNEVDSRITMVHYIQRNILEHKCRVQYRYIENYDNFHDKITFAETQAGKQVASTMQSMVELLQNLIKFISFIYLLMQVNVWIVVSILVTSIPAIILSRKQKDELYYSSARWIRENSLALHYYFVCSNDCNVLEIRQTRMFPYMKSRWRKFCNTYIEKKKQLTIKHVKWNVLADIPRSAVYLAILFITVKTIYTNEMVGLGIFTLVYSLTGQMQEVTAQLFNQVVQLITNIAYIKDFFYLDTLKHEEIDNDAPVLKAGDIVFQNVSFHYPNAEKQIFQGLNVTIKKGEKVAILGENGSGKSTFINLLCGMFEPDQGSIKISDCNVSDKLSEVRKSISVVLQDFGRYNDTLRNNIVISDEKKNGTDEEIIELAKQLKMDDVINIQQEGLNEQIGTFSYNANDLSGGQWQKVAILRAAYKDSANIMILDEPTAALDPLAEAQIYRNFSSLTGDRTTILVSHRLGITSLVDRIIVFKDGKIVEDGSHADLMKLNGEYYRMYQAQAQWYK